ncbi:zinc finger protein 345-like isoform X2 [Protopterus annectens]|uniref:zinc finger protein 345-like isoform X2 n=1 Tax=Protopterus annectens TaxID=7888 RepID=UPI001CF95A55|nr:zinc finger protein 345-like isoform X2 [Protopterus annectens]
MVQRCVAYGCSNTHSESVSLHKFPADPVLRGLWNAAVGKNRADWLYAKNSSRLCSAHFTVDSFDTKYTMMKELGMDIGRMCPRLKPDAVPTIFCSPPSPGMVCSTIKKPQLSVAVDRHSHQEAVSAVFTKNIDVQDIDEHCSSKTMNQPVTALLDQTEAVTHQDLSCHSQHCFIKGRTSQCAQTAFTAVSDSCDSMQTYAEERNQSIQWKIIMSPPPYQLEIPENFEDVAVKFSDEEWKMLTKEEKRLHRLVMMENYENMVSVGYNVPLEHLWLLIRKKEEFPHGDTESAGVKHHTQPSYSTSCISRNADHHGIRSQHLLGKLPDHECSKTFLDDKSLATHVLVPSGNKHNKLQNCNSDFSQKSEQETRLERHGGQIPCKMINHSSNSIFHSNILTGKLICSEKEQKHPLLAHEEVFIAEKKYKCVTCGEDFTQQTSLVLHQIIHFKQKPYKCATNDKGFTRNQKLMEHIEWKFYKCSICNKGFVTKNNLLRHQRSHTDLTYYNCTMCNKSFTDNKSLARHQTVYCKNNPFKCTMCDKRFTDETSLVIHRSVHAGLKPFRCTTCDKSYADKQCLRIHQRIHTGIRPYKCTSCDKRFIRRSNLTQHQLIHTIQKPFKCTVCGKNFRDKSKLSDHHNVHIGECVYKCNTCDRMFTTKKNLVRHRIVHTGHAPYKCTLCNRGFKDDGSLEENLGMHAGQKPYICTTCEKGFTNKKGFLMNESVHTGEKPYKCPTCNKTFAEKRKLSLHEFTHTRQKPYKCAACDKCFTLMESLTAHQNSHTGQRPYKCTMCAKGFMRKRSLEMHRCIHCVRGSVPDKNPLSAADVTGALQRKLVSSTVKSH